MLLCDTFIINWLRRNTAISSLQTALYDWAFSNLKAVPEDQAAVFEALASGNADGSMMDITEEEMLELLRMQGGDDDLGFDLGRKISAEQRMQDREVLRRRKRAGVHVDVQTQAPRRVALCGTGRVKIFTPYLVE